MKAAAEGVAGGGGCLVLRQRAGSGVLSELILSALFFAHHPYQLPASGQLRASAPV